MAFTLKGIKSLLSDAGLPVDALDKTAEEICSRHNTTLDAIKEERDTYKHDSETLVTVQAELDKLKSLPEDGYKAKYEQEHKDFETFKQEVKSKETASKIRSEYRKLLDESHINAEDVDLIMNATKFDEMKLDGSDKLIDAEKLKEGIKTKYARYIHEEGVEGAPTPTPIKRVNTPTGANSRAAELAKQYHERRYGKIETKVD